MPRVKQVTARKDYPSFGIKKGDLHYTWSLMLGPRSSKTFRQMTPPRPSQLTTSEFLGRMGDLELEFSTGTAEGGEDFLRNAIAELEEIAEAEEEKRENVPENLYYSEMAERMEERAEEARSWANEIEQFVDEALEEAERLAECEWYELEEFDGIDPENDDEEDFPTQDEIDAAREAQIAEVWAKAVEDSANACPGCS